MITRDEIGRVAELMRIEIGNYDEHVAKIQKMVGYFDHLDSAKLPDSFERGLVVDLDSLRDDVAETPDLDAVRGLKFGVGSHMRSPRLR